MLIIENQHVYLRLNWRTRSASFYIWCRAQTRIVHVQNISRNSNFMTYLSSGSTTAVGSSLSLKHLAHLETKSNKVGNIMWYVNTQLSGVMYTILPKSECWQHLKILWIKKWKSDVEIFLGSKQNSKKKIRFFCYSILYQITNIRWTYTVLDDKWTILSVITGNFRNDIKIYCTVYKKYYRKSKLSEY